MDDWSGNVATGIGFRTRVHHADLGRAVAFFFLRERLTRPRIIATISGFVGVLVIVRPGLAMVDPAAGLVLIAAAGYGLSLIFVKRLTRDVSPAGIVVWMIMIQLPLGLAASLTDWRPVQVADIPWMMVAGLGALSAHYCQAQALKRLDASVAMPIDFLRVPLAAIVGYLVYAEAIDLWVFIGGGIIMWANYRTVMIERRGMQR